MKLDVSLSYGCARRGVPARVSFVRWATTALAVARENGAFELSLRIVDETEGLTLNRDYRGKAYATNVLSFPTDLPARRGPRLLGDIALCAAVVSREAHEQSKTLSAHYAHLTVHGVLHLLGYDHEEEAAAAQMEALETEALAKLGFTDPYETLMSEDSARPMLEQ